MMSLFLSFPKPRELNSRCPAEFDRIVYRALADEAYGLTELRLDLEDFVLK